MTFSSFIYLFATVFLIITSLMLIIKGDNRPYQIKLIGFSCMIYALVILTRILGIDFELILTYPHLLGVFSPLLFLPSPLFFIIIRNILLKRNVFSRYEVIHFFPAFIHLLDMIPFYIKTSIDKFIIAELIIKNPYDIYFVVHGIIPGYFVYFTRVFLFLLYLGLSLYYVISAAIIKDRKKFITENWIYFSILFLFFLKIAFLFQFLNIAQFYFTGSTYVLVREVIGISILFVILVYVFYNYYRLNLSSPANQLYVTHKFVEKSTTIDRVNGSVEIDLDLNQKLKALFEIDKIFLQSNITATELANLLSIRSRDLAVLIQDTYNCSYRELINRFRIEFAKSEIEKDYLDKRTLESLASDSGFNSRITFFNAFKKETGVSPSQYVKSIK